MGKGWLAKQQTAGPKRKSCKAGTLKSRPHLRLDPPASRQPLFPRKHWRNLPGWVVLHAERGNLAKCWEGHRLETKTQDGRRQRSACVWCEKRPKGGSSVQICPKCPWWVVCSSCACRPRLPKLQDDPLFHGPHSPCLLSSKANLGNSRGTVIICPGGNYEFLVPQEGMPAVECLAAHGIRAVVLRYRLLPRYYLKDALEDLRSAVDVVRKMHGGPVAAMGFSAGGHLVASLALESKNSKKIDKSGRKTFDAQVLVYPCIDSSDWGDEDCCGFVDFDSCFPVARSLLARRESLLGGPGFAAPPTFMVASTKDEASPPKHHTDRYASALRKQSVPFAYLKRDYGPHGFGLAGGWMESCAEWLEARGFGRPKGT